MTVLRRALSVTLASGTLVVVCGCPLALQPLPAPGPVDAAPFPPNRTAAAVLDDLVASGCAPDAALPGVEQAHARLDRSPRWDCLFLADASVSGCGGCP